MSDGSISFIIVTQYSFNTFICDKSFISFDATAQIIINFEE